MKILIIGNGFIGGRCAQAWNNVILHDKMIEGVADVLQLLDQHKPDVVLNAAGIVGKPNVDWCETNQLETIKGNTILPLIIAEACQKKNIYLLHIGTGCIFYGDSPLEGGWKEDDYANPVAVYTRSKYAADLVLATLDNEENISSTALLPTLSPFCCSLLVDNSEVDTLLLLLLISIKLFTVLSNVLTTFDSSITDIDIGCVRALESLLVAIKESKNTEAKDIKIPIKILLCNCSLFKKINSG